MHVQINVHDPLEPPLPESLNGEDGVVDVAEALGVVPLRVVPTPEPVDGHADPRGGGHGVGAGEGGPGHEAAEQAEVGEAGAVVACKSRLYRKI